MPSSKTHNIGLLRAKIARAAIEDDVEASIESLNENLKKGLFGPQFSSAEDVTIYHNIITKNKNDDIPDYNKVYTASLLAPGVKSWFPWPGLFELPKPEKIKSSLRCSTSELWVVAWLVCTPE
jgi:hypothetical protein